MGLAMSAQELDVGRARILGMSLRGGPDFFRSGLSTLAAVVLILALSGCDVLAGNPPTRVYSLLPSTNTTTVGTAVEISVASREVTAKKTSAPWLGDSGTSFTWQVDPATGATVVNGVFTASEPGVYTVSVTNKDPNPAPVTITVTESDDQDAVASAAPESTPTPTVQGGRETDAIAIVQARMRTCINGLAADMPAPSGEAFRQSSEASLAQWEWSAEAVPGQANTYTVLVLNGSGSTVTVNVDTGSATINNPSSTEACLAYFD